MRFVALALMGVLAGTAHAGPIARVGTIGGYDTSAPGNFEQGLTAGLGYQFGRFTAAADYGYLEYNSTNEWGGSGQRAGVVLQTRLLSATCHDGRICPHLDLDVGAGLRWLHWQPQQYGLVPNLDPVIDRQGRELRAGLSATFGFRFSLEYVLFQPDAGPGAVCRGVCPMQVDTSDSGVLLEVGYQLGGA